MNLDEFTRKVFRCFVSYRDRFGAPPTVRKLMAGVNNRSFAQVTTALNRLEDAGLLHRIDGEHRNWRLTDEGERMAERLCDHVFRPVTRFAPGRVRAGAALQEWQEILTTDSGEQIIDDDDPNVLEVSLRELPVDTTNLFALKVYGDSMIDALILEGDIVIVRRLASADELRNGMMVIARILADDSVTLKYYERDGEYVELRPANSNYPVRRLHSSEVEILGVVVRVIRRSDAS